MLGQRVVTSQIREEFPASPSRDLYRALSPGYSPTGDLEWQDEFDFDVASGDQRFKQMLLPKLQLLQNQLITEFYDMEKREAKKKLLVEGIVSVIILFQSFKCYAWQTVVITLSCSLRRLLLMN